MDPNITTHISPLNVWIWEISTYVHKISFILKELRDDNNDLCFSVDILQQGYSNIRPYKQSPKIVNHNE